MFKYVYSLKLQFNLIFLVMLWTNLTVEHAKKNVWKNLEKIKLFHNIWFVKKSIDRNVIYTNEIKMILNWIFVYLILRCLVRNPKMFLLWQNFLKKKKHYTIDLNILFQFIHFIFSNHFLFKSFFLETKYFKKIFTKKKCQHEKAHCNYRFRNKIFTKSVDFWCRTYKNNSSSSTSNGRMSHDAQESANNDDSQMSESEQYARSSCNNNNNNNNNTEEELDSITENLKSLKLRKR